MADPSNSDKSIEETLAKLTTSRRSNCSRWQVGTTTPIQEEEGAQTQSYNESLAKIPIPILAITAFQNDLIDPLDLIISIKKAANDFNDSHKETEDESFEDAKAGAEDFLKWLYAVHLGLIPETRLSAEPDNKVLVRHLEEQHRLCIPPPAQPEPSGKRTSLRSREMGVWLSFKTL
jgi:hypothetical protein